MVSVPMGPDRAPATILHPVGLLGQNLFIHEHPIQIDPEDGLRIYLCNAVDIAYIHTVQRPKSTIKRTTPRLSKVQSNSYFPPEAPTII
jgi:hypothetical protein